MLNVFVLNYFKNNNL